MPWDPQPLGAAQQGRDELPVILGSSADGAAEALLIVSRPANGRVRVREWSGANWSAPPRERELAAHELLAEVEAAQRAGRRLNHSLYGLRLWLSGAAP